MSAGHRRRRSGLVPLALALAVLTGCSKAAESKHVIKEPVTVEKLAGTGLGRLTLTEKAAERLGIETVAVEEAEGRWIVPSDAVLVDAEGKRYVYVNTRSLVYERQQVGVLTEHAGKAFLDNGPPAGTHVVTTGAAELHGAETGIK